jgi:transcriptional regulator with XRE-family HTH domain
MAAVVVRWTGREAGLLRNAGRMSVRAFAAHLGVSARTVSKWEAAGTSIKPSPDLQAVLDTALQRADLSVRARFEACLPEPSHLSQQHGLLCDWEDDLDRAAVEASHQNFTTATRLLAGHLDGHTRAERSRTTQHLLARSLVLSADMRRDQGSLGGPDGAAEFYARARMLFSDLDESRRTAQTDLALTVVQEMTGRAISAARKYRVLAVDSRLGARDQARAQLWVGTALGKNGLHQEAAGLIRVAIQRLADLDEHVDWSVGQQKLALALRAAGKQDQAVYHIGLALDQKTEGSLMQDVRLSIAHAHVLLSDHQTRTAGLVILSDAEHMAERHHLRHQRASAASIKLQFDSATIRGS